MADWLPKREQDLVDLCQKWAPVLADGAKISEFGWDQVECAEVLAKINAFLSSRSDYETVNSTERRLAKDEAKGEAVDVMREFANASIRFNKKMSDPARLVMGIHPKDTTPTSHGAPGAQPGTEAENTRNHYEHRVRAINTERGDHSKPEGVYGVRYGWQNGGTRPVSGADLPKSKFSRKTTLVVQHTEGDKGQPAFYSTCYENSKGETGPWSPVVEAIIG